jgi:hypothetical protein
MSKRLPYLISILVLLLACTGYADIMIGDFEDGVGDWALTWEGTSTIAVSNIGATSGSQSLAINAPANVFSWAVMWEGLVDLKKYPTLAADVTWIAAEWDPQADIWVNFKDVAINSDGPSGWQQYIPNDELNPAWPGSWDPANWGDNTRTLTWDISNYDATGATYLQLIFSTNMGSVTTPGTYYIDNVRLIPYPPAPVGPYAGGLVAYYPMENNVNDATGNGHDGVFMADPNAGDPNFVEGLVCNGMALDLDGVNDYVDCGYDPVFDFTDQMTVSAWVTIRSIPTAWMAATAKGEYAWRLGNANMDPRFHFGITIWNAPDTASVDATTAVGYDEWHHIAGVYDGASINVYLDGELDGSAPTTEPIGVNDKNVFIGDNPDAIGRYWDGLVDEVKIFGRALSNDEVRHLAGYRSVPADPGVDNLVAYYPLENNADDASGNGLNGTFLGDPNTGEPNYIEGPVGMALDLDGVDDYIDCGNDAVFDITDEITLAAWVNPRDIGNSQDNPWLGKGDKSYAIKGFRRGNVIEFFVYDGGWYTAHVDVGESFNGEWHHTAGVYNGKQLKFYVDGELGVAADRVGGIALSTSAVNIGKNSDKSNRFYDGAIDEAVIYNRALSVSEILYIMGERAVVDIDVANASFELGGKQSGFDDVPGWNSVGPQSNLGVTDLWWTPTDGDMVAWMGHSSPSIWQLTDHVIECRDIFDLDVDAALLSADPPLQIVLYYDDDGARVPVAVGNVSPADEMAEYSLLFTASDVPECIGHKIGIELANVSGEIGCYIAVDNVRLVVTQQTEPVKP